MSRNFKTINNNHHPRLITYSLILSTHITCTLFLYVSVVNGTTVNAPCALLLELYTVRNYIIAFHGGHKRQ